MISKFNIRKITAISLAILMVLSSGIFTNIALANEADYGKQIFNRQIPKEFYEQEEKLRNKKEFKDEDSEDIMNSIPSKMKIVESDDLVKATTDSSRLRTMSTYSTNTVQSIASDANQSFDEGKYVIQKVDVIDTNIIFTNVVESYTPLAFTNLDEAITKMMSLSQKDYNGNKVYYVVRHKDNQSQMKIAATNEGYAIVWPLHGSTASDNEKTVTYVYDNNLNYNTYLVYETLAKINSYKNFSGTNYVKALTGGVNGYIKSAQLDIVPGLFIEKGYAIPYGTNQLSPFMVPTYRAVQKDNYKEMQYKQQNYNYYYGYGVAPDWMIPGNEYYSFDGIHFYTDKACTKLVNTTPYYNYYQFLPIESKSKVTAEYFDLNTYLRIGTSESAMKNLGWAFVQYQESSDINALITYAIAVIESGTGRSYLALNKNNLFGWQAVDTNPIEGASYFESASESVREMMEINLKTYTNTYSWKYTGTSLGNKAGGLNNKYSSNTAWAPMIACIAYELDKLSGFVDYNNYQLALADEGKDIIVRKDATDVSQAIQVKTSPTSTTYKDLIIEGRSKGLVNQVSIVDDNSEKNSSNCYTVKIANSSLADARFDTIQGFVPKTDMKFINYGFNYNKTITPEPEPEPTPKPIAVDPVFEIPERKVQSYAEKVNIREKASSTSAIVGQLLKGTTVTAYNEYMGWTKTNLGWVSSKFLYEEVTPDRTIYLRDNPNGDRIGYVYSNQKYLVKPYSNGWSHVLDKGYCSTSLLNYTGLKLNTLDSEATIKKTASSTGILTGSKTYAGKEVKYRYVNKSWIYMPYYAGYAPAWVLGLEYKDQ